MSVYYRYFKIGDAATLARIAVLLGERQAYREALAVIKKEIGAESMYFGSSSGEFAGFGMPKRPDMTIFIEVSSGVYYPKKSTKTGKQMAARLALPVPEKLNAALKIAGMDRASWCLMDGLSMYSASVCGSDEAGWFAVIPWKDVDPAELAQYEKDRAAGARVDGDFDHLLWKAPAEWVAVKEWEFKKAMDEAREAA